MDAGLARFFAGLDGQTRAALDSSTFRRQFELTGVQRHLKAAGIFARLLRRDGKARYMADVPTALDYIITTSDSLAELDWLKGFIRRRVLPALARAAT